MDALNKAEAILDEAESSLDGFVVAMDRKLCHAAMELIRDVHKHLVEAHAVLELVDEVPPLISERYLDLLSGLQGAQARYKSRCTRG